MAYVADRSSTTIARDSVEALLAAYIRSVGTVCVCVWPQCMALPQTRIGIIRSTINDAPDTRRATDLSLASELYKLVRPRHLRTNRLRDR